MNSRYIFVSSCLLLLSILVNQGCTSRQTAIFSAEESTAKQFATNLGKPLVFRFDHSIATGEHYVNSTHVYNDNSGYGFDLETTITPDSKPFYFSVRVPEGNYRVTVELGHHTQAGSTTVRAESRRLYIHNAKTSAGEFVQREFIVNIRNSSLQPREKNAPGTDRVSLKEWEQHYLHWDNKLTLEFNGDAPSVRSITVQQVNVPTVYLVGDSTVTDQPYEPAANWGQMLTYFLTPPLFNGEIAVANHAESGETMKSFVAAGRFAKVLENMKVGDYLLIQFGHNDQKKQWPQTYVEAKTTYRDYLKVFIAEARLRGATPILITSVQRRTFNSEGKIANSHGLYPQAVREVARRENVTLLDLDVMSVKFYEALGVEKAPLAFNDNGKDATHHNSYGAYQLAQCLAHALRDSSLPISSQLRLPKYNPARPDPIEQFNLQPSPQATSTRINGN